MDCKPQAWIPAMAIGALATMGCGADEEPLNMPPPGGSTPVAIVDGDGPADSGPSDSSPSDPSPADDDAPAAGEDCDPLGDPALECGPGLECNPIDLRCHEAEGTGAVDEPCTVADDDLFTDDCLPELFCGFVSAGTPRCVLPCQTLADDCPVGTSCVAQNAAFGFDGYCLETCDPLVDVCPRPGDACVPLDGADEAVSSVCAPAGTGVLEDECTVSSDCGEGFVCTDAIFHESLCNGADRCCSAVCDTDNPACIGLDFVCTAFNDPANPTLGFCSAP